MGRKSIKRRISELEDQEDEPNKVAVAVRHPDGTLTDFDGNAVDGTYTKMCFEITEQTKQAWESSEQTRRAWESK
jgi:hypothetical protein